MPQPRQPEPPLRAVDGDGQGDAGPQAPMAVGTTEEAQAAILYAVTVAARKSAAGGPQDAQAFGQAAASLGQAWASLQPKTPPAAVPSSRK